MDTAKEVVTLIKFSPKRENLQGEIKENLEEPESAAKGIIGLCPTRWTVHARCFQRILDNYAALLQEWIISIDGKLQSDIRGRIIGCQAQMNTFHFFFRLNLEQRLFSHTDNLSKTSQQTRMSAISNKRVAHLTKEVLQEMRSDASFKLFYDAVILKSKNYSSMTGPVLPRRTRAPRRIEIGTGEPASPATTQDYCRQIYFESIDLMVNAIEQRFDQPSFAADSKMEISYADDVDVGMLTAQLEILKVLLFFGRFSCFFF